jgi:hypothetical protein
MNFIKIVTVVNWIAIGLLLLLVGAETLFPAKGGDAAGRGIGQAFYYLSIFLLILFLILNLLPFQWSKYTCFAIIMIPIVYFTISPTIEKVHRNIVNRMEAKPWFEDKERQCMAEAIMDANPDKLQNLLQSPSPLFQNKDYTYPLLNMAVRNATSDYTNLNKEDRIACVRLLLQAGASITSSDPMQEPVHFKAVSIPDTQVLKMLLEHGADPNARGIDYSSGTGNIVPILFEAVSDKECVRLLLEYGADPNATKPVDGDTPLPSVLLYAASVQRWDICRLLIEKSADPTYQSPDGTSLRTYLDEKDSIYQPIDATPDDLEFVKKALASLK